MTLITTVLSSFAATTDSPLFIAALMLTFAGIGTIVASFFSASREHKAKK